MLTLDQLAIHKDYRKYLRIQEGIKGNMLNTLINATEKSLPALIREHIKKDFVCIYDDIYTIEELLTFSLKLKSDDEILAGYAGYISYKALEAYIKKESFTVLFDMGKIQPQVLQHAEQQYAWLAGQLQAEFSIPSVIPEVSQYMPLQVAQRRSVQSMPQRRLSALLIRI